MVIFPSFQDCFSCSISDLLMANDLFRDLGIKVVTVYHFLGGFVGDQSLAANFVSEKVAIWYHCVQQLSNVAMSESQASFAALVPCLCLRRLSQPWCHVCVSGVLCSLGSVSIV